MITVIDEVIDSLFNIHSNLNPEIGTYELDSKSKQIVKKL